MSNQLPGNLTMPPVQTGDKWLATTYNRLPECGYKELHQKLPLKASVAMTDVKWHGKQAATFTTKEPTAVTCAKQQNYNDCGMCVWLTLP